MRLNSCNLAISIGRTIVWLVLSKDLAFIKCFHGCIGSSQLAIADWRHSNALILPWFVAHSAKAER
jgi:hypothetical protein